MLRQGVWKAFEVRFENDGRVRATPRLVSASAPAGRGRDRWLDLRLEPAGRPLTGSRVEHRTLWLRSRDAGKREATFTVDVGQGTQDLGFRGAATVLFECLPRDTGRERR